MRHAGIENSISSSLEKAVRDLLSESAIPLPGQARLRCELEIPKDPSHGDLSTNIAMQTSSLAGADPAGFAERIRDRLVHHLEKSHLKAMLEKVEVKPPGFLNFYISRKYLVRGLLEIKRKRDNFGRSGLGRGIKVQMEFVSANPTGPLTIAHGRQAAVGSSLANILEFLGYTVTKEYYINDEGTQMDMLAASLRSRYRQACGIREEFPKDGYKGSYITDIARTFKSRHGKRFLDTADLNPFKEFALRWILNDIKKDLKDFGVRFNVWFSQKRLRRSGKVERALEILKEKGYIYESEGATWFKSTVFGDDKDRVVVKSDGSTTYLAPDIAYHLDKYKRGFRRIIDIWGPDHHGYVPRMKAAVQALGYSKDSFSALIVQLATLSRGGELVSMSTRAGEFITLREVMDEAGKDVARFCFLMRRLSSHLNFDLETVKSESSENPVYYIQYAHARIWSIIGYARKAHFATKFDSSLLKEAEEIALMRTLRQFPTIVTLSGKNQEPYTILQYLQDLATLFHSFYNKHRVISDDPVLSKARMVLVDCVRIVLANGLRLLGVSLPKKM
jgi:arginyl-tRNA synthetase